jgi:hypothetical protein
VPWVDVYEPRENRWSALPDMPRARDHFQAVVVGAALYAIGGSEGEIGRELEANDAFDLRARTWRTGLAPLPTPRGGFAAAAVDGEILVIGGEAPGRAYALVEAYDPSTDRWRTLAPLGTARHGIQAAVCDGAVFVAAGGRMVGGGAPTDVHEVYAPGRASACGARHWEAEEAEPAGAGFPDGLAEASLRGGTPVNPTSLAFGPDGRLYVAQRNGTILAYSIGRTGRGEYVVDAVETIDAIRSIPNHDDDGSSATDVRSLLDVLRDAIGR